MPGRSNRSTLLALCVLPAFAFGAHAPGALPVGSFFYACGGSSDGPTVRKSYAASKHPAPRPKSSPVEVYEGPTQLTKAYERVGVVAVVAHNTHTSTEELKDRAIVAAREMGGDALLNVQFEDAAHVVPKAGDVGSLCLIASVVRWSESATPQRQ